MIRHDGKPIPGWDAPLPWWRRWKVGIKASVQRPVGSIRDAAKEILITFTRKF